MDGNIEILSLQRGRLNLTIRRSGSRGWQVYYGVVNGEVRLMGRAKGEVLRRLLELTAHGNPVAPVRVTR